MGLGMARMGLGRGSGASWCCTTGCAGAGDGTYTRLSSNQFFHLLVGVSIAIVLEAFAGISLALSSA